MARRKSASAAQDFGSYVFEVEPADPHYSLGVADPKREMGLYTEYWHLELMGRCLGPPKLAGRLTRLLFIATRSFFDRPAYLEKTWRPLGVAHLTMRGDRSELSASLPYDAAWGVATSVANGLFKYLALSGTPLKRGSAQISFMTFRASYDPEDYF